MIPGASRPLLKREKDVTAALEVAEVTAVVPISFITPSNIPVNKVDAAMAKLLSSGRTKGDLHRLCFGGGVVGVAQPYAIDNSGTIVGDGQVYKVGRTTGYTEGTVTAIAGTVTLAYPGGKAFFADQIVIASTTDNVGEFSTGGDSGSSILNSHNELVGLLFAGSKKQTFANPIGKVMSELQSESGIGSLVPVTA